MPEERKPLKPVHLPCPRCGEPESPVSINLNSLGGDGEGFEATCTDCGEEFDLNEIRGIIAKWAPVLAWIDTLPNFVEG